MTPSSPDPRSEIRDRRSSPTRTTALGALFLLLTHLAYITLLSHKSLARQTLASATSPGIFADIDRLLAQVPSDQDVFLLFKNFNPDLPADQAFASAVYFRACYLRYPHRVLAADPDIHPSANSDLLRANSPPTSAWLVAHHIPILLTIEPGPAGTVQTSIHHLPN